jgi:polyphosphate kinase
MSPLLTLLREASSDDSVHLDQDHALPRRQAAPTSARASSPHAENGKDVTVLMELRARFDEANNIAWAERLEEAGCTVIYGSEGFKCHSKICQITYHDGGISRITCLGTGNFNEKTARCTPTSCS